MYDTILEFLNEDDFVDSNIDELYQEGFNMTKDVHKEVVEADHARKEAERIEKERI